MNEPVTIRAARDSDQGYVIATWMRSLQSSDHYKPPRDTEHHGRWFREQCGAAIDELLERRDTNVIIAENAAGIVGWIAYTAIRGAPTLHYVYVRGGKNGSRRQGIARRLIEAAGIDISKPLAFTFVGPSFDHVRGCAPRAVFITPREFLS